MVDLALGRAWVADTAWGVAWGMAVAPAYEEVVATMAYASEKGSDVEAGSDKGRADAGSDAIIEGHPL